MRTITTLNNEAMTIIENAIRHTPAILEDVFKDGFYTYDEEESVSVSGRSTDVLLTWHNGSSAVRKVLVIK